MLRKIDNILYRVSDLETGAAFYRDVLGLKQLWRDDATRMIGFGLTESDAEIVIHANPDLPDFDFSFLVDDVEALVRSLRLKGVSVELEPIDVRSGKYAVIRDPSGNRIPLIDLTTFGGTPRFD